MDWPVPIVGDLLHVGGLLVGNPLHVLLKKWKWCKCSNLNQLKIMLIREHLHCATIKSHNGTPCNGSAANRTMSAVLWCRRGRIGHLRHPRVYGRNIHSWQQTTKGKEDCPLGEIVVNLYILIPQIGGSQRAHELILQSPKGNFYAQSMHLRAIFRKRWLMILPENITRSTSSEGYPRE